MHVAQIGDHYIETVELLRILHGNGITMELLFFFPPKLDTLHTYRAEQGSCLLKCTRLIKTMLPIG